MKSSRAVWLGIFVLVVSMLFFGATRDAGPRTQQQRIDSLTSNLACPTCSGESVFASRASAAEAIRSEVARQVASGLRSDEEILGYIEQRFGGQVLLVPRANGIDALVWALPVVALIFATFLIVAAFYKWRSDKPTSPSLRDEEIVADALSKQEPV